MCVSPSKNLVARIQPSTYDYNYLFSLSFFFTKKTSTLTFIFILPKNRHERRLNVYKLSVVDKDFPSTAAEMTGSTGVLTTYSFGFAKLPSWVNNSHWPQLLFSDWFYIYRLCVWYVWLNTISFRKMMGGFYSRFVIHKLYFS